MFLAFVALLLPLAFFSEKTVRETGGSFDGLALALLLSLALAALSSYLLTASLARRIKNLSSNLGQLHERLWKEPPPDRHFDDEIERADGRAKSLAERIMETMNMLRDEKEKIRAIIDQMDDGVALMDSRMEILLHNEAFTKMFDAKPGADWTGLPMREVVRNPHLLDVMDKYAATGAVIRREIPASGGSHMAVTVTTFRQDLPQKRTLLVLHDITQQKKIEQMRADFVANASHELKTPLTAISGFVETMADGSVDDPETAKQFLAIIQKHVERLARLVDDLLTLSDIELGREKLDFAELNPEMVIKGVEQFFQNGAASAGITISRNIGPDFIALRADRDKLTQILINLVDNAIKYTPRGGRVEISCKRLDVTGENSGGFGYPSLDGNAILPETEDGWTKSFTEFCVSDTGEGIPQQSLPRLMERFYRVDNARSRERGGTGLGLAIVKHILIAHGGSIRIESELGRGTSIRFIIPG